MPQLSLSPIDDVSTPLFFVENVGQFAPDARFQMQADGGTLWLTEQALWLTVWDAPAPPTADERRDQKRDPLAAPRLPERGVAIRLSFEGAKPAPRLEGGDALDTTISYLRGNDPAGWRSAVPVWGSVRYHELYDGVDLLLEGSAGQLQSRLVGTNAAANVTLRIEGAAIQRLEDHVLHLATAVGDIAFPLPHSDLALTVVGEDRAGAALSVVVAANSHNAPQRESSGASNAEALQASTFFGGSGYDAGDRETQLERDASGNIVLMMNTTSSDLPTDPGAFDPTYHVGLDIFVARFNPALNHLLSAIYLGGMADDRGTGLDLDADANIYLSGVTTSEDFPVTPNAYDPLFGDGGGDLQEGCVVALTPNGSELLYSSFLNYSASTVAPNTSIGEDVANDIAVGASGAMYIVGIKGVTFMPTYSITSYLPFLIKIAGDGVVTDFTYNDSATPVAVVTDDEENVSMFVHVNQRYGPWNAAIVRKYSSAGKPLMSSWYQPGWTWVFPTAMAADASGNLYITGEQMTDPTAVQEGMFVAKVDGNTGQLLSSNLITGSDAEYSYGISVFQNERVALTGYTLSTDFPTTPGAFSTTANTDGDGFLLLMNAADLQEIEYGSYLGGAGVESINDVAFDDLGNAFVAGTTQSADFPTTPSGYDPTYNGNVDAFIAKWRLAPTLLVDQSSGAPGSFFNFSALNFMPNTDYEVSANGVVIGTVTTDDIGVATFQLDTTDADAGTYLIEMGGQAVAVITLDPAAATHPQSGTGPILTLPAGIAFSQQRYLPLIAK